MKEVTGVSDEIKEKFLKIINENVEISTINIVGKLELVAYTSDGIEFIKNTLQKAKKIVNNKETRKIDINYLGAPHYRIEIVSKDYMDAENILSEFLSIIEKEVEKINGKFEFQRD